MINNNLVTKHIINKIKKSELFDNPFAHKFVKNIFPIEIYNKLLQSLPDKSFYVPIAETGLVSKNYSPERFVIDLAPKNIEVLQSEKKSFFKNLIQILISPELFSITSSQFRLALNNTIKNFTEKEKQSFGTEHFEFTARIMLVKDFTKYSLEAHTDSINKFITYLFYLPSNDSLSKIGTTLYEKSQKSLTYDKIHYSKEETKKLFLPVKTCPFIPNSLLIFPRSNDSFHGVEEINTMREERNLLSLNYFFKKKN